MANQNSFSMFDDASGIARNPQGSQPWEPPSLLDDELDGVMPAEGGLNLSMEGISQVVEEEPLQARDFKFKEIQAMNPEELHKYLYEMKEHYQKVRGQNKQLDEKLYKLDKKEKQVNKEQKQTVFQNDTVAMMAKYQLVFVKMENSITKVFNSNKLRWYHLKQKAFFKIRDRADERALELNQKTYQTYFKLYQKILTPITEIYQKNRIENPSHEAFRQWKLQAIEGPRQKSYYIKKQEKEVNEILEKMKKQGKLSREKENLLEEKQEQLQKERNKTKVLKQRVEEQERKERQIGEEVQAVIYKNTTTSIENQKDSQLVAGKAQRLEADLQKLRRENRSLKDELESTQGNISSFFAEMNQSLEQHEGLLQGSQQFAEQQPPMPGFDQGLLSRDGATTGVEGSGSTGGSHRLNNPNQ